MSRISISMPELRGSRHYIPLVSEDPDVRDSHPVSESTRPEERLQLRWDNVTCSVFSWTGGWLPKRVQKTLLRNVSGCLTAGQVTAIMGPESSGKTNLLNCLTGQTHGLQVRGNISLNRSDVRIAFVPKDLHMFPMFTVYETILFASRITNHSFSREEHQKKVLLVLQRLDLLPSSRKKISSLALLEKKCVAIAREIVSDPDVLILDEPTTGLESTDAERVEQQLKNLCNSSSKLPAIALSIHSPSKDTFTLFDQVYLLTRCGRNIYSGPPDELKDLLTRFDFQVKGNPAEYAVQVASGKFGDEAFDAMADLTRYKFSQENGESERNKIPVKSLSSSPKTGWCHQFCLIFHRNFSAHVINWIPVARCLLMLMLAVLLCHLSEEPVASPDACVAGGIGVGSANASDELQQLKQAILGTGNQTQVTIPDPLLLSSRTQAAIIFLVLSLVVQMVVPVFTCLKIMSREFSIFQNESRNKWHNSSSLFFAIILNEAINVFMTTFCFVSYSYWASGLPFDPWFRYFLVFASHFLTGHLWSLRGLLIAVIFHPHKRLPIIATVGTLLTSVVISGLSIRYPMLEIVSDVRNALTIILTAVFGYERCSGGQLMSYFAEEVMPQKSLMRISTAVWPALRLSQQDLHSISRRLQLRENYLDPVIEPLNDFLGTWDDLGLENDYNPSIVMRMLGSQESDVPLRLMYLVGSCLVTQVLLFLTLAYKFLHPE